MVPELQNRNFWSLNYLNRFNVALGLVVGNFLSSKIWFGSTGADVANTKTWHLGTGSAEIS